MNWIRGIFELRWKRTYTFTVSRKPSNANNETMKSSIGCFNPFRANVHLYLNATQSLVTFTRYVANYSLNL